MILERNRQVLCDVSFPRIRFEAYAVERCDGDLYEH